MTRRQQEIWNELRSLYDPTPFWNSEAYPEHNNAHNGARRVMWALKRAGYIREVPNHQWQLGEDNHTPNEPAKQQEVRQ